MRKTAVDEGEYNKIIAAEKETQDKQVSRKFKVFLLRHENLSNTEITERLGPCGAKMSRIVSEYRKQGLDVFMQKTSDFAMRFAMLGKAVRRLRETIKSLAPETITSIILSDWIYKIFN